jgi:hypothetical protein
MKEKATIPPNVRMEKRKTLHPKRTLPESVRKKLKQPPKEKASENKKVRGSWQDRPR